MEHAYYFDRYWIYFTLLSVLIVNMTRMLN